MTNLRIVSLERPRLSDMARIEKECFSSPWSEDSLSLLLTGENGGLLALDGECAMGYIGYLGVVDEYEITNVAVSPNYRRRGIGEALVRALLKKAEENEIVRVTLDVRPSNLPALTLYEKLGFIPCGARKNFYTNPREDAIIMEWKNNQ